jgi:hypothetical protein
MELRGEGGAVEVETESNALRQVLRLRDPRTSAEVALDPIELEGLTRTGEIRFEALLDGGEPTHAPVPAEPRELWVLQNEFAMVQVGPVETERGGCLFIRDLGSRTEVCLDATALRALIGLAHHEFAPLLDPSQLVQADEPDPDQV